MKPDGSAEATISSAELAGECDLERVPKRVDDDRLGVGDVGGRGQRSFSTEPMVGSISSGTNLGDGLDIDLCFRTGVLGDADAWLATGDISYAILAGGDRAGGGIWRAERPRDLAVGDPR